MEGPPIDLFTVADAPFSIAWVVFIHAPLLLLYDAHHFPPIPVGQPFSLKTLPVSDNEWAHNCAGESAFGKDNLIEDDGGLCPVLRNRMCRLGNHSASFISNSVSTSNGSTFFLNVTTFLLSGSTSVLTSVWSSR